MSAGMTSQLSIKETDIPSKKPLTYSMTPINPHPCPKNVVEPNLIDFIIGCSTLMFGG